MDIGMLRLRTIRVLTEVSNLLDYVGHRNRVSIFEFEEIEELMEFESGRVANLGTHRDRLPTNTHIGLNPRSFTEPNLSQLLYDQEVPYARVLSQRIAHDVMDSLANDKSLHEPLFVTVKATFIKERRLFFPHLVFPLLLLPSGASREVLQRLVEEQRVKSADMEKEDGTCSICTENFSESHENIIRMPNCLHMFHHDCLFKWLCRQNSCPLCRKVPYEEG